MNSGLVRGLENGINGMIGFAEPEWLNEVRSIWGQLEITYALVLDEDRSVTSVEHGLIDDTFRKWPRCFLPTTELPVCQSAKIARRPGVGIPTESPT